MKTNRLAHFVTACSLLAFSTAGCAEKDKLPETPPPAEKPAEKPADSAEESPATAFARWSELKGYTFDRRELFLAGLKGLETRVDALITELVAQRAALETSNTSTADWDFAMKEMRGARTNLKSTSDDMAKASRENWDQLKDKVGLAWVRAQDAYAKVKASTTK